MSAIRKSLLQLIFAGSYMRRWNDKLRPVELYEIDKQAHKMIVAWMLTLLNSEGMCAAERIKMQLEVVEQGLFDYLYRLVITDIKPPVFYKIREDTENYKKLTDWVLQELEPVIKPLDAGFWERFQAYSYNQERSKLSDRILKAAHQYASGWEFNIIRPLNEFDEETPHIGKSFLDNLNDLADIRGVRELTAPDSFFAQEASPIGRFAKLCGQLRFQIRWSETPRVPETTVLGHMFLVATYAYCFSLALGVCPARRLNNFFAGLFHDLPELLTRDIITPVKRSTDALPNLIRDYELQELEERVFQSLLAGDYSILVTQLRYYLGLDGEGIDSEFNDTVRYPSGEVIRKDSFDVLQQQCNSDDLDPKDGSLLKACDRLAAFMEAHTSVCKGISSRSLIEASSRLRNELCKTSFGDISLNALLADFD